MGIEMKIATFVLSLLSVSGQTTDGTSPDERRKKWKTTEATTTLTTSDPATTTTTTTTTSTETTTSTAAPTTTEQDAEPSTTRVHTLPPNIELGGDKDTKQNWDPVLFNQDNQSVKDEINDSDDPDIVHTGHQFGSMLNLETKGPILDEVKAPDQGKGGKKKGKGPKEGKGPNKKDSDDSDSEPESSDDEEKVEEPKKKKKQKESKKSKGGKKKKSKDEDGEPPGCNEKTLRKTYNIDDGMNVTTQEKKKRTNFQISCDNGLNPNFNFVTCKDKKGQIDFERFSVDIGRKKNKNKKRTNDNDAGNPNISVLSSEAEKIRTLHFAQICQKISSKI